MQAPTPDTAPVVNICGVEKVFNNGARALAPITQSINGGECVTIIGPSGCGKTTLLKLIANLYEPTVGRLLWWGGAFDRVGEPTRRIAFVFQEPTLMPWASVATNVRLPLDLARLQRTSSRARVEAALAKVEMTRFARVYPRQLSGGQRMRVSIARALVTEPNLILMDEPFGALDEFTRNKLDDDLAQVSWDQRLTTVFVTHSIYEAVYLSTRVVVMASNPGRIFQEMTIDEPRPRAGSFRNSPRFAEACRKLSNILTEAAISSRTH